MMKAYLMIFGLLLICSGAALAQGTPDLLTPAQETICDGETGAAFGLCNAYCEAMDCDSPDAQASATACSKVKSKFTNLTGRGFLPCETCPLPPPGTTCPCDGIGIWDSVLSGGGPCLNDGTFALKAEAIASGIFAACTDFSPTGDAGCGYLNFGSGSGESFFLPLSTAESSACFYKILDSCNP